MFHPSHLFINSSYLLLNLIFEDFSNTLVKDVVTIKDPKYFRVGMRLYDENDYLAPFEESADTKIALLWLVMILLFAVLAIYLLRIDHMLLQLGGDAPGDSAIKDHVKDLYPNLIELAYKDRNFGSRQKLSQCIRNFYQGPDARSN